VACAAADTQDWDQALAWFTRITDVDPGYRDAQERAENARKQQQITRWQAEARRLHQNAQWAGVVKVGQRLHALDPAAADPDGLVTSARTKLAAAEQAERLDADYETALRLLDAGDWRQAIQALERVAQVNPAYRATPALLDRARQQLAHTGPPPTPPRASQKEAEDKAPEEAEDKAREEAEDKAPEEAEGKAREEAEGKAREEAEGKAPEQAAFDLGSLFDSLFGEGSTTAQRGRHIHAETTLSSIDAAQGGTVTLRLKREGTCPTCHGTGAKAGSVLRNCSACNGTGKGGKRRISASAKPCRTCRGRGLVIDDPCPACSGAGRLTSTNTLKVRFPAGVEDGTSLQFSGEGEPSQHGGPAGDLYLLVHVRP
jgi:hypothetical protein